MRLLIIHEDPARGDALAQFLSKLGPVLSATSRSKAVEAFSEQMPDVVVCSHTIDGDSGGLGLCRELRGHEWGTECLLVVLGVPGTSVPRLLEATHSRFLIDVALPPGFLLGDVVGPIQEFGSANKAGRKYPLNLGPRRPAPKTSVAPSPDLPGTPKQAEQGADESGPRWLLRRLRDAIK